jgi:hypothetical protein
VLLTKELSKSTRRRPGYDGKQAFCYLLNQKSTDTDVSCRKRSRSAERPQPPLNASQHTVKHAKSLSHEVGGKAAVPQTVQTHGKVLSTPLADSWDKL